MDIERDRLEVSGDEGGLTLVGELDAYTSPALASALDELGLDRDVTLDVDGITFIDSSALRVLVLTRNRLHEAGHALRLRFPSDSVRRLLDVSGLGDHFEIVDA